uniref:NADH-ubiquinone oxidoreductase chain 5 n=1 Tax=Cicadella viridis TaxID=36150 RepID=A0A6B9P664_CICVR|nr:NADH dehydrogenase subunit 5 [Cicadella viridis]
MNFYFYWFLIFFSLSICSSLMCFYFMIENLYILLEWKIFFSNSISLYYILLIDWISLSFCSVVLFISSMVILYSMEYIGMYNYSSLRFLFLVVLFVLSMLLMIMSPNLISILLGWDGLGLVSYCLVIYYSSLMSYNAGMITCLTNRIGDIGLLITICWFSSYGSWNFIFYCNIIDNTIFYLLVFSSFTKSAQIPFSCWLPAAMAAPTPVSSLVHSSTLVTAGVYLLIRFFNKLNFNNILFIFLSIMTMMFSSFCAMYENDLKKIIALSTLSQLGLMMSSLFIGLKDLTLFHLLSHAMFKSLLFLCAGIYIFYMNDNQDIRYLGSVCNFMPYTTSCFNIANMALCGIPFLSGFYSKDMIIEFMVMSEFNYLIFMLFYISLGMTACYSIRLFYFSMMKNMNFISFNFLIDETSKMKLSIFLLTIFSIMFGSMFTWMMYLDMSLIIMPFYMKIMSFSMVMLGILIGLEFNNMSYIMYKSFYMLNSNMWFMNSHLFYLLKYSYNYSNNSLNNSLMWGEYYGGMGISYYISKMSNFMQFYSLNNLKIFLLTFYFWSIFMI